MKKMIFCILLVSTLCGAVFSQTVVPGSSFNAKMRWLTANVQNNGKYIIEIADDESITPMTLSFSGKNNISITIIGIGSNPITFSLTGNGSMFTVESGITLILGDKLTLRGGIQVNSGGRLVMNNGSSTGRVYVGKNGTFTMNGGEISGNTASNGGGVYVAGTFIMNDGKIFGNTSSTSSYGGGVYVEGTFIMNGGEISGNTASSSMLYNMADNVRTYPGGAGGVYVAGTFTMTGGKISGNASRPYSNVYPTACAGGVYVNGTFTMKGGEISDNSASHGGGVFIGGSGTFAMENGKIFGNLGAASGTGVDVYGNFVMSGGEISDNKGGGVDVYGNFTMKGGKIYGNGSKTWTGGGVCVNNSGTFTMERGEIFGNTATVGGGVCVNGGTTVFNKTGGTIYGYSSDDNNSNIVVNEEGSIQKNLGYAVYVKHSNNMYVRKKDATSGPSDKLSFNGKTNPPTSTGEWEWDF